MNTSMKIASQLGDYNVYFHREYGFLDEILLKPNTCLIIDSNVAS